ncbi:hypothetical protein SAMN06298216_1501 [Spirosomataceae bacterium TFI 002]|nr:hypothetical protein SAMN06298216_1501 [Spirosomataceae bacterium TFI 002]
MSNDSLENYFQGALSFLENNQEKETVFGEKYKGEWPGEMALTTTYIFIGRKRKARDSNCFTVSAIHNFLAEMYLEDPSLGRIKPMLKNAFEEIKTYESNKEFHFWKKLPPNRKLSLFKNPDTLHLVSRPTNFKLRSRFINNTANVPADADDTSLGNLAFHYQNSIFGTNHKIANAHTFDKWHDTNRKNRQWYNFHFLQKEETNAYLTWLHPEHEYKRWNSVKMSINTFFIFMPGSTARPKAYKPWVPFGSNDVDIVVNANILSYLAITNQTENSTIASQSAAFLNQLSTKERYWDEAIYYPNSFHAFYAWARAYRHDGGINEKAALQMAKDLTELQQADGSFQSSRFLKGNDPIQATAYGLHAMLDLKEKGISIPDSNLDNAVSFLLNHAKVSEQGVHWEGGVFFSGGTVLRNILLWKSDAYTTALIARCIQKYQKNAYF